MQTQIEQRAAVAVVQKLAPSQTSPGEVTALARIAAHEGLIANMNGIGADTYETVEAVDAAIAELDSILITHRFEEYDHSAQLAHVLAVIRLKARRAAILRETAGGARNMEYMRASLNELNSLERTLAYAFIAGDATNRVDLETWRSVVDDAVKTAKLRCAEIR